MLPISERMPRLLSVQAHRPGLALVPLSLSLPAGSCPPLVSPHGSCEATWRIEVSTGHSPASDRPVAPRGSERNVLTLQGHTGQDSPFLLGSHTMISPTGGLCDRSPLAWNALRPFSRSTPSEVRASPLPLVTQPTPGTNPLPHQSSQISVYCSFRWDAGHMGE